MIGNRTCNVILFAACSTICSPPPASAAKLDGNWSMVAATTRGHCEMNAIAGPRTAHGTGRFGSLRGSGTWAGRGPSGLCSGVWSAVRS
jgi:hypothetical protein